MLRRWAGAGHRTMGVLGEVIVGRVAGEVAPLGA